MACMVKEFGETLTQQEFALRLHYTTGMRHSNVKKEYEQLKQAIEKKV